MKISGAAAENKAGAQGGGLGALGSHLRPVWWARQAGIDLDVHTGLGPVPWLPQLAPNPAALMKGQSPQQL